MALLRQDRKTKIVYGMNGKQWINCNLYTPVVVDEKMDCLKQYLADLVVAITLHSCPPDALLRIELYC